jgi:hypothetical protein
MVTLYRCDVCHELVDPVDGDEMTELTVFLDGPGETEEDSIHMCEDCRPQSAVGHMDWLTHTLETEVDA